MPNSVRVCLNKVHVQNPISTETEYVRQSEIVLTFAAYKDPKFAVFI